MTSAGSPSRCGPPAEAGLLAVCRPGSRSPTPRVPVPPTAFRGLYLPESYFTRTVSSSKMPVTASAIYRGCRVCTGFKTVKCRGRRSGEAPQVRLTGLFCPVRKPWR